MFGVFTHEYCKIVPQLQYISGKVYLINQRPKTPLTQLLLFNYIIIICNVTSMCGTNGTNTDAGKLIISI